MTTQRVRITIDVEAEDEEDAIVLIQKALDAEPSIYDIVAVMVTEIVGNGIDKLIEEEDADDEE